MIGPKMRLGPHYLGALVTGWRVTMWCHISSPLLDLSPLVRVYSNFRVLSPVYSRVLPRLYLEDFHLSAAPSSHSAAISTALFPAAMDDWDSSCLLKCLHRGGGGGRTVDPLFVPASHSPSTIASSSCPNEAKP